MTPKNVVGPTESPQERKREEIRERLFLSGPQPRGKELRRAIRIFFECLKGFRALHFVGPCVTVFGSARFKEGHPHYEMAVKMGEALAHAGFTVMTGGGPGIMEAANRGAKQAGGHSVGCNIHLPQEQKPNPYLDVWIEFKHFFVRKLMLAKYSYAFIALPGGYGTLDELFEVATLVQTGKMDGFPIVLMGSQYWSPLVSFLRETMVREQTINAVDIDRILVSDSPAEVADHIKKVALSDFGLKYGPRVRRRWYFLEPNFFQSRKPQDPS
jgi:uncharacterized protein (TIGR00730 family)